MPTQLQIRRGTATENDAFTGAQGELTYDTTNKRIRIHDGATQGGFELKTENSSGDTLFADDEKAIFGAGNDLQIYHSGTHSFIKESGTGNLKIQANEFDVINSTGSGVKITNVTDGAVKLGYGSGTAYKLETTSTGIDVTGTVTADGLTVGSTDKIVFGTSDSTGIYRTNSNNDLTMQNWANASILIDSDNNDTNRYFMIGNDSQDAGTAKKIAKFDEGGDISFYEDTGTTAKFFWDASAESLGIGTSSPSSFAGYSTVGVNGSTGGIYDMFVGGTRTATLIGASSQTSLRTLTSSPLVFYTDSAERARIDNSGNVGIGTSSPSRLLDVDGIAKASIFDAGGEGFIRGDASGELRIQSGTTATTFRNNANNTEYMRCDSSGNLLVGKTISDAGTEGFEVQSNGSVYIRRSTTDRILQTKSYNTNLQYHHAFVNSSNSLVGSIAVSTSATAYNTSSDYRLKTDVQPMTGATERLKALNPVNFAWKVDGSRVDGFLAHEAAEVVPEAVTGEKDAVEAIGNVTDAEGTVVQENVLEPAELAEGQTWTKTEDRPVYQGIDQSKLTPLLTAALQDTIKLVEDLQAEVAALKAQLNG